MAGPVVAELIVGVSRDPSFGLTLLVGSGGTLVELVRDSVSILLPATPEEIDEAIRKLKVARLIEGWRGETGGDFDAIADAIKAIAEWAIANGNSLVEMDVNPLIVLPDGVAAADAIIRLAE